MKSLISLATIWGLSVCQVRAVATWPSSYDELEDVMMLNDGYRSRGFGHAVTPCSHGPAPGKISAAGFLRTAFHDIAAADVAAGTGGLDASIGFELDGAHKNQNKGGAFNGTINYLTQFYNGRASMADLLAMTVYASVRSCGGPSVPIKTGRIDATSAGLIDAPSVNESTQSFTDRFSRMGFSQAEMIQLVACGHTLGGVHSTNFPTIAPTAATAATNGVSDFVPGSKPAFDQKIASSYVDGTTQDPLVVGPDESGRADLRIFSSDGNTTIKNMVEPTAFQATCRKVLQKMIETVPAAVRLTDAIVPYDVKPSLLLLDVSAETGALKFSGEIRVRTTPIPASSISKVELVYKDRKGGSSCGSCVIGTTVVGTATGFDDTFTFYGFSASIAADTSISSFVVRITLSSGRTDTFNNNGKEFPVSDIVFVQQSSSTLSQSVDSNGNQRMNIVAAVRSIDNPVDHVDLTVTLASPWVYNTLPSLQVTPVTMTKTSDCGSYSFFTAGFNVPTAQVNSTRFDVSLTSGGVKTTDSFNSPTDLSRTGVASPSCAIGARSTTSTAAKGQLLAVMSAIVKFLREHAKKDS